MDAMVVDGSRDGGGNNGCVQVVMSGNKGRWGAAGGRYILREGFICCKSDFESAVQKTQGENHHESKGKMGRKKASGMPTQRMTVTDALIFSKWRSDFYPLITPEIAGSRHLDSRLSRW
jgi:hypothetical protein